MKPWLQDADLTVYQGDCTEVLRVLVGESVHMAVTSPPFYGLRDFGVDGQIGLEETPEEWCANLVDVFREVKRVLRDDGTLWVEVGDSCSAGGLGLGGSTRQVSNAGANLPKGKKAPSGCKAKDLIGAPWMLAFALRNDGWYLRSDIIWARPNPMPESVRDRPTKAHSYLFLLTKQPRYFFDQEAMREPYQPDGRKVTNVHKGDHSLQHRDGDRWPNSGRNIRSVWEIPTQPLPYDHYAAFPEALVERCIKAGTSEGGVCGECGAPWVREVDVSHEEAGRGNANDAHKGGNHIGTMASKPYETRMIKHTTTTGWARTCVQPSDSDPVPATVLDPFLGSGTTALVARRLGRRCVGIELNERYCEIAAERTRQLSLMGDAT